MILVIADDLTGAAEIAGVGLRHGLATRMVRGALENPAPGLTVIDTDSRLLPAAEAARTIAKFTSKLRADDFDLIYKKTDSVLRGPVQAELQALMEAGARDAALLVPQNPSRGRTIAGGIYRIDGVPLDQTAFAGDPDHPARSAGAADLLGDVGPRAITIGDAGSSQDLAALARSVNRRLLPAGGAEFFGAMLESRGLRASRPFLTRLSGRTALFVCGSASAYSRELVDSARRHGFPICPMPDGVFSGAVPDVGPWSLEVSRAVSQRGRALVTIGRPIDRSPGTGTRLQTALAELVCQILSKQQIDNLLVDGGATASAISRRMAWNDFEVEAELCGGVVQMRVAARSAPRLIIKPGSYAWPGHVFADQS